MDSSRTRRLTAGAVVVTMVAGLMALVVLQPASAIHTTGLALEMTPEVSGVTIGGSATPAGITARLVDPLTGEPKAPPTAVPVVISFEVIGGPADTDGNTPASPDATCDISGTATECTPGITATVAGSSLIRGWIEEDNTNPPVGFVEADLEEDRLSDLLRDCTTEVGGDFEACQEGTPVAGSKAERDNTDVVFVQFTTGAAKLNCEPETGRAPRTEAATITCTVLDTNDNPVAGQRLDGENIAGANDPDSANGGTPDYKDVCVTGENGTCAVSIPGSKNELGTANICLWVDSDKDDVYTPGTGQPEDGKDCGELKNATENDNTTDVVSVEWQDRTLTSLDVAPDIPSSSTVGGSHTLTATALDQFGAKIASDTVVKGEFFTGSPKDTDANTPATPDLGSCSTTSGDSDEDKSTCTFTYTSASSPGTDVMCFWFGADPVMTGSGTGSATCTSDGAGEKLVGGTDAPRVDVVSKSWSAAPPPSNTNNNTTVTTTPSDQGYTLVGSDGGIFTYGTSKFHGSTGDLKLNQPVVGMANKKGATGYWLVAKDGGIFSFGDAEFFGSTGDIKLNAPILGMEATPSGKGYFLYAEDGGIFTFGDAVFRGSTGDRKLNKPAVGMAVNEKGDGYWLVAQDGGIFSFGRVPFHGSTGDRKLNEPVFDMAPTAGDNGYWLVAKDGGVFSFGDAERKFYGSAVGATTAPVIGMGATPSFNGYWIADSQGAVFHFGDALFLGDRRGQAENAATVGFATVPKK